MLVNTKILGKVEIEEGKILHFINGMIGFPDLTQFALVHDEESGSNAGIRWLQSIQEPKFAIPVIEPLCVVADYNPKVEDELLKPLGEMKEGEVLVLTIITVPSDLTKMSINLKAPIVINVAQRKASQIITESDYPVKFPIYEILKARKEGE